MEVKFNSFPMGIPGNSFQNCFFSNIGKKSPSSLRCRGKFIQLAPAGGVLIILIGGDDVDHIQVQDFDFGDLIFLHCFALLSALFTGKKFP